MQLEKKLLSDGAKLFIFVTFIHETTCIEVNINYNNRHCFTMQVPKSPARSVYVLDKIIAIFATFITDTLQ